MDLVFLDCGTLGKRAQVSHLKDLGNLVLYDFTDPDQVQYRIRDADVVITNKVPIDKVTIENCTNLRLIVVTASVADIVDIDAAERAGVRVRTIQDYATNSVAQFTVALVLSLLCKVSQYSEFVSSGRYSAQKSFAYVGDGFPEIRGSRVGVIGMGKIGRRVAELMEAFGAQVVYYSSTDSDRDTRFPRLSFEELVTTSEVITIHAPLTELTNNLIDAPAFALMKRRAILVNTGRGAIVNEAALARALGDGSIAGAALDVFDAEPLDRSSPLLRLVGTANLVLTPHCAWGSDWAQARLIEETYRIITDDGNVSISSKGEEIRG